MSKLVKESEYFVAWILFWLCCVVGGFIIGAVVGAVVGGFLGASGVDLNRIGFICGALGFVVSIPISYAMFRVFVGTMIVRKIERRMPSPNASDAGDGSQPPNIPSY